MFFEAIYYIGDQSFLFILRISFKVIFIILNIKINKHEIIYMCVN